MENTDVACSVFEPKVGKKSKSGWNYTSDFYYALADNKLPYGGVVSLIKPADNSVNARACESVDCMHPCYGNKQIGACNKCVRHMMAHFGERHSICDLCVM